MTFIPYTPPSGAVVTPPVHAETIVTVFYSDGDHDNRLAAGNVNWSAEGDGPRVVAYRVVEEHTPPKEIVAWAVVGSGGITDFWSIEDSARACQRKFGGTLVKLTGVMS